MNTRDRILDAAARVMASLGLARATTKEIARAAGYSEATLYKHFDGKEELFLCVLRERFPEFVALTKELSTRVGRGTVRGNLEGLARAAASFYEQTFPMAASLFSEPRLLAAHREGVRKRDAGPQKSVEALAAYLRAEQGIGRVSREVDPDAAAMLLLGGCFQHAFLRAFLGHEATEESRDAFAAALARTLDRALIPGNESTA